jgi:hypothetical protein
MGKDWNVRWTKTIDYLNQHSAGATLRLGDHIETLVPTGMKKAISEQLSLGSKARGSDDKRHAMRGLLLCQRVYYSDLWAKKTFGAGADQFIADAWVLDPAWKTRSVGFWGGKGEDDILKGIEMFVPAQGATRAKLAEVARKSPPSGEHGEELPGNLFLSRADTKTKGAAETCYNGVVAWLLQSGIVSMRWVMRDSAPNGEASCDRHFGTGETIWQASTPFKDDSRLPVVPEGYLLHMWDTGKAVRGGPSCWNGHWVVSNGDGTVCGVNNGEKKLSRDGEDVNKKYTNNATLRGQFEGYGGFKTKEVPNERGFLEEVVVEPREYTKAQLVKIDPMDLPNLM